MKLSICIVFNHSIGVHRSDLLIPRSEAEFVKQLAEHFSRVAVAGFIGRTEGIIDSRYDGVLSSCQTPLFAIGLVSGSAPKADLHLKIKRYISCLSKIVTLLKKFDYFYIFIPGYVGFIISMLCRVFRKRYGVYVRGEWNSYPRLLRFIHLQAVKHADFALVTGPAFADRLRSIQPRIETVYPMLAFSPEATKTERSYGIKDLVRLLFVGSIVEEKGVFDLLEAVKHLNARSGGRKRFNLTLVGTGPDWIVDECSRKVKELNIAECVTFVGHVSDPELLRKHFEKADIFVFPSYYREGFPRVIYEAMLTGLPVIATCLSGTEGVLIPNENFVPVSPHNPLDIAEKVWVLTKNEELRRRIGRRGEKIIKDVLQNSRKTTHAEQVAANIKMVLSTERVLVR